MFVHETPIIDGAKTASKHVHLCDIFHKENNLPNANRETLLKIQKVSRD